MARKKKKQQKFPITLPLPLIKTLGVICASLIMGALLWKGIVMSVSRMAYFNITTIVMDPSLSFINKRDLGRLQGQNIFLVDLDKIQKRLAFKYPQVANLHLIRRFPNKIQLVAKKRVPFAQINLQGDVLTLNERGIILSMKSKKDKKLPFIKGRSLESQRRVLGEYITDKHVQAAITIIKTFQDNRNLAAYQIIELDVTQLSKMHFLLSNELKIILDTEKIHQKIGVLGVLLTEGQIDFDGVKYIDLRFKNPISGR